MDSRERVIRAIEFKNPDRIPVCTCIDHDNEENTTTDQVVQKEFPSDVIIASAKRLEENNKKNVDEWGCRWDTKGNTMGEVIQHPIQDWEDFEAFKKNAPDFTLSQRYQHINEIRKKHPDKFLLCGIGFMMMDIINFRGYENYMLDLYLEKENLKELIHLIYEKAYERIDKYAELGADGIIAWEDWGLQDRLMMNPELWREFFKEPMTKMIRYIHSKNMKYILHCCGYVKDIMDDFLEIGVDVLQFDQQQNMGLDYLHQYAGKICFFCPADIQLVSRNSNMKQIEEYCRTITEKLSVKSGGFMYKTYSQPEAIQINREAVLEECRSFEKYNPYL